MYCFNVSIFKLLRYSIRLGDHDSFLSRDFFSDSAVISIYDSIIFLFSLSCSRYSVWIFGVSNELRVVLSNCASLDLHKLGLFWSENEYWLIFPFFDRFRKILIVKDDWRIGQQLFNVSFLSGFDKCDSLCFRLFFKQFCPLLYTYITHALCINRKYNWMRCNYIFESENLLLFR